MDKMSEALSELEEIRNQHDIFGKNLFSLSNGKLFPCDSLYFTVLNRSLELFDGFLLLAKNGNYGCCMALFRMQLDNIIRFYGILLTQDPHETSSKIFDGIMLKNIKDKDGNKLTDAYLVKFLSNSIDWIDRVYKLCSGYIHLSDEHVRQMVGRTEDTGNGKRNLYIGANDSHIQEQHWVELINGFKTITGMIFNLFVEWEKISKQYDQNDLETKYSNCL